MAPSSDEIKHELPSLADASVDVFYIDAWHSYEAVSAELAIGALARNSRKRRACDLRDLRHPSRGRGGDSGAEVRVGTLS